MTDTALTGDARVEEKQQEKLDKYQKLTRELKSLWKVNTKCYPDSGRCARDNTKNLEINLKTAETTVRIK